MNCARCHGLMVEQSCWEREFWQVSRRWTRPLRLWSCLNCGNCLDKTIAFHQHAQREEMASVRHKKIWEEIIQQMQEVA